MEITRRTMLQGALAAGAAHGAGAAEQPAQIFRVIPSTGEGIPMVGIGSNAYDVESAADLAARKAVLEEFPALGGRLIDTARGYGRSEEVIGAVVCPTQACANAWSNTGMRCDLNMHGAGRP